MTGDSGTDETMFAELDTGSGGPARVVLRGRLDAEAVAEGWARIVEPLCGAKTSDLQVDASGLSYCDGAGIGLLVELKRLAAINGGRAEITGLSAELEPLLRMATLGDPARAQLAPPPRQSLIEHVSKRKPEPRTSVSGNQNRARQQAEIRTAHVSKRKSEPRA